MSLNLEIAANTPADPTPATPEPRVRGESLHDRASSALLASAGGVALVFTWLTLVWATQRAYAAKPEFGVVIIEVAGEGRGAARAGDGPNIDLDAQPADEAANPAPDADGFEEPALLKVADAAIIEVAADAKVEVDTDLPVEGGADASGPAASRLGLGNQVSGTGVGVAGQGSIRREERWSVAFPAGQTLDEYARVLDSLRIELGTTDGKALQLGSAFSTRPVRRVVLNPTESRLFFLWQGGSRKADDIELLRKAGIVAGTGPVFHFYPKPIEDMLAQLEARFRDRTPDQIRSAKFAIVPAGRGKFGVKILSQELLR